MGASAFGAAPHRRANQQDVLGATLEPTLGYSVEYGIQFVGLDPYTPEEIVRWFDLVKATVYASDGADVYYVPTFEQSVSALTNAEYLASRGVPVASTERWVALNDCYSPGWALGRLKYFPTSEIDAVFADVRLRPEVILLIEV